MSFWIWVVLGTCVTSGGISNEIEDDERVPGTRSYRQVPPPGRRLRRKWVRLFIGSARRRRIWSMSALSLAVLSRSSPLLLVVLCFFLKDLLQYLEDGKILGPAECSLALYDV